MKLIYSSHINKNTPENKDVCLYEYVSCDTIFNLSTVTRMIVNQVM